MCCYLYETINKSSLNKEKAIQLNRLFFLNEKNVMLSFILTIHVQNL